MSRFQVAFLGVRSLFNRTACFLIQQSKLVKRLFLYDEEGNTDPPIYECDRKCEIQCFRGEDQLPSAIKDADVVIIGDEYTGAHGLESANILEVTGPNLLKYTEAIAKYNPRALVMIATSPLNCTVPLVTKALENKSVWNCNRVVGVTKQDTLYANHILSEIFHVSPSHVILPIIGGNSSLTRVPLLSQLKLRDVRGTRVKEQLVKEISLIKDILLEDGDYNCQVKFKAVATSNLLKSILNGFNGVESYGDIALSWTILVEGTDFFSLPHIFGKKGVEFRYSLPSLTDQENDMVKKALEKLNNDIVCGQEVVEKNTNETGEEYPPEIFPIMGSPTDGNCPLRAALLDEVINLSDNTGIDNYPTENPVFYNKAAEFDDSLSMDNMNKNENIALVQGDELDESELNRIIGDIDQTTCSSSEHVNPKRCLVPSFLFDGTESEERTELSKQTNRPTETVDVLENDEDASVLKSSTILVDGETKLEKDLWGFNQNSKPIKECESNLSRLDNTSEMTELVGITQNQRSTDSLVSDLMGLITSDRKYENSDKVLEAGQDTIRKEHNLIRSEVESAFLEENSQKPNEEIKLKALHDGQNSPVPSYMKETDRVNNQTEDFEGYGIPEMVDQSVGMIAKPPKKEPQEANKKDISHLGTKTDQKAITEDTEFFIYQVTDSSSTNREFKHLKDNSDTQGSKTNITNPSEVEVSHVKKNVDSSKKYESDTVSFMNARSVNDLKSKMNDDDVFACKKVSGSSPGVVCSLNNLSECKTQLIPSDPFTKMNSASYSKEGFSNEQNGGSEAANNVANSAQKLTFSNNKPESNGGKETKAKPVLVKENAYDSGREDAIIEAIKKVLESDDFAWDGFRSKWNPKTARVEETKKDEAEATPDAKKTKKPPEPDPIMLDHFRKSQEQVMKLVGDFEAKAMEASPMKQFFDRRKNIKKPISKVTKKQRKFEKKQTAVDADTIEKRKNESKMLMEKVKKLMKKRRLPVDVEATPENKKDTDQLVNPSVSDENNVEMHQVFRKRQAMKGKRDVKVELGSKKGPKGEEIPPGQRVSDMSPREKLNYELLLLMTRQKNNLKEKAALGKSKEEITGRSLQSMEHQNEVSVESLKAKKTPKHVKHLEGPTMKPISDKVQTKRDVPELCPSKVSRKSEFIAMNSTFDTAIDYLSNQLNKLKNEIAVKNENTQLNMSFNENKFIPPDGIEQRMHFFKGTNGPSNMSDKEKPNKWQNKNDAKNDSSLIDSKEGKTEEQYDNEVLSGYVKELLNRQAKGQGKKADMPLTSGKGPRNQKNSNIMKVKNTKTNDLMKINEDMKSGIVNVVNKSNSDIMTIEEQIKTELMHINNQKKSDLIKVEDKKKNELVSVKDLRMSDRHKSNMGQMKSQTELHPLSAKDKKNNVDQGMMDTADNKSHQNEANIYDLLGLNDQTEINKQISDLLNIKDQNNSDLDVKDQTILDIDLKVSDIDQKIRYIDEKITDISQKMLDLLNVQDKKKSSVEQNIANIHQKKLSGKDQNVSYFDQKTSEIDRKITEIDQKLSNLLNIKDQKKLTFSKLNTFHKKPGVRSKKVSEVGQKRVDLLNSNQKKPTVDQQKSDIDMKMSYFEQKLTAIDKKMTALLNMDKRSNIAQRRLDTHLKKPNVLSTNYQMNTGVGQKEQNLSNDNQKKLNQKPNVTGVKTQKESDTDKNMAAINQKLKTIEQKMSDLLNMKVQKESKTDGMKLDQNKLEQKQNKIGIKDEKVPNFVQKASRQTRLDKIKLDTKQTTPNLLGSTDRKVTDDKKKGTAASDQNLTKNVSDVANTQLDKNPNYLDLNTQKGQTQLEQWTEKLNSTQTTELKPDVKLNQSKDVPKEIKFNTDTVSHQKPQIDGQTAFEERMKSLNEEISQADKIESLKSTFLEPSREGTLPTPSDIRVSDDKEPSLQKLKEISKIAENIINSQKNENPKSDSLEKTKSSYEPSEINQKMSPKHQITVLEMVNKKQGESMRDKLKEQFKQPVGSLKNESKSATTGVVEKKPIKENHEIELIKGEQKVQQFVEQKEGSKPQSEHEILLAKHFPELSIELREIEEKNSNTPKEFAHGDMTKLKDGGSKKLEHDVKSSKNDLGTGASKNLDVLSSIKTPLSDTSGVGGSHTANLKENLPESVSKAVAQDQEPAKELETSEKNIVSGSLKEGESSTRFVAYEPEKTNEADVMNVYNFDFNSNVPKPAKKIIPRKVKKKETITKNQKSSLSNVVEKVNKHSARKKLGKASLQPASRKVEELKRAPETPIEHQDSESCLTCDMKTNSISKALLKGTIFDTKAKRVKRSSLDDSFETELMKERKMNENEGDGSSYEGTTEKNKEVLNRLSTNAVSNEVATKDNVAGADFHQGDYIKNEETEAPEQSLQEENKMESVVVSSVPKSNKKTGVIDSKVQVRGRRTPTEVSKPAISKLNYIAQQKKPKGFPEEKDDYNTKKNKIPYRLANVKSEDPSDQTSQVPPKPKKQTFRKPKKIEYNQMIWFENDKGKKGATEVKKPYFKNDFKRLKEYEGEEKEKAKKSTKEDKLGKKKGDQGNKSDEGKYRYLISKEILPHKQVNTEASKVESKSKKADEPHVQKGVPPIKKEGSQGKREDSQPQKLKGKEVSEKRSVEMASQKKEAVLDNEKKKEAIVTSEKKKEAGLNNEKKKETVLNNEKKKEAVLNNEKKKEVVASSEKKKEVGLSNEKKKEVVASSEKNKETVLNNEKKKEAVLNNEKKKEAVLNNEKLNTSSTEKPSIEKELTSEDKSNDIKVSSFTQDVQQKDFKLTVESSVKSDQIKEAKEKKVEVHKINPPNNTVEQKSIEKSDQMIPKPDSKREHKLTKQQETRNLKENKDTESTSTVKDESTNEQVVKAQTFEKKLTKSAYKVDGRQFKKAKPVKSRTPAGLMSKAVFPSKSTQKSKISPIRKVRKYVDPRQRNPSFGNREKLAQSMKNKGPNSKDKKQKESQQSELAAESRPNSSYQKGKSNKPMPVNLTFQRKDKGKEIKSSQLQNRSRTHFDRVETKKESRERVKKIEVPSTPSKKQVQETVDTSKKSGSKERISKTKHSKPYQTPSYKNCPLLMDSALMSQTRERRRTKYKTIPPPSQPDNEESEKPDVPQKTGAVKTKVSKKSVLDAKKLSKSNIGSDERHFRTDTRIKRQGPLHRIENIIRRGTLTKKMIPRKSTLKPIQQIIPLKLRRERTEPVSMRTKFSSYYEKKYKCDPEVE